MAQEEHARPGSADALAINGIQVAAPLTLRQGQTLAELGLLADDPAGLRMAWERVEGLWAETVTLAHRELPASLNERVNDEWSLSETLRHLIFVTDSWIGVGVRGLEQRHPLGLPPHFVTNGRDLGLDLDADPDVNAVLDARAGRQRMVAEALAEADNSLDVRCREPLAQFSHRGAFQVVIAEEIFHRGFAMRDLAVLGVTE